MKQEIPSHKKKIAALIRDARKNALYTQEEFAHTAKLDRGYYGKIERGEVNVGLDLFLYITSMMNIEPQELLPNLEELKSALQDSKVE